MIRVDRKLNSTDVVDALTDLFILRGAPSLTIFSPELLRVPVVYACFD